MRFQVRGVRVLCLAPSRLNNPRENQSQFEDRITGRHNGGGYHPQIRDGRVFKKEAVIKSREFRGTLVSLVGKGKTIWAQH